MVNLFNSFMLYIRCKKAIRHAKWQAVITGKKQLVLMYGGKPIVVSKQHLKAQIRQKKFAKGFTPAKAEALAIFKTQ